MIFSNNKSTSSGLSGLEQLLNDLSGLLSSRDLDSIPQIRDLRNKLNDGIGHARDTVMHVAEETASRTREAARASNEYAHDEPWRVAGTAFAVGALIGFCLGKR